MDLTGRSGAYRAWVFRGVASWKDIEENDHTSNYSSITVRIFNGSFDVM